MTLKFKSFFSQDYHGNHERARVYATKFVNCILASPDSDDPNASRLCQITEHSSEGNFSDLVVTVWYWSNEDGQEDEKDHQEV